MPKDQCNFAVLTGDIIGSTELGPDITSSTIQTISECAREIVGWNQSRESRFTRNRGDGWQFIMSTPHESPRAAIFVAANLRALRPSISSRISIGIGTVDNLGTGTLLSDASGAAFIASGRGLDQMKRPQPMALAGEKITEPDKIILQLLAEITGNWSQEQAEAMAFALHPDNPTLAKIAPRLAISPQAVNYRLRGASLSTLRNALSQWEDDLCRRGINSKVEL